MAVLDFDLVMNEIEKASVGVHLRLPPIGSPALFHLKTPMDGEDGAQHLKAPPSQRHLVHLQVNFQVGLQVRRQSPYHINLIAANKTETLSKASDWSPGWPPPHPSTK